MSTIDSPDWSSSFSSNPLENTPKPGNLTTAVPGISDSRCTCVSLEEGSSSCEMRVCLSRHSGLRSWWLPSLSLPRGRRGLWPKINAASRFSSFFIQEVATAFFSCEPYLQSCLWRSFLKLHLESASKYISKKLKLSSISNTSLKHKGRPFMDWWGYWVMKPGL